MVIFWYWCSHPHLCGFLFYYTLMERLLEDFRRCQQNSLHLGIIKFPEFSDPCFRPVTHYSVHRPVAVYAFGGLLFINSDTMVVASTTKEPADLLKRFYNTERKTHSSLWRGWDVSDPTL